MVPFSSLAVVGLGSMYFHATLSHLGQQLDEGPMACIGAALIFVGHFADKPFDDDTTNRRRWAGLACLVYVLVVVAALVAFPEQTWIFLVLFIPGPTYAIYRASTLYSASGPVIQRQIRFAMACAVFSWLGWGVEPVICGTIFSKVQLHAWWHVGVCLATFLYIHMALNVEHTARGHKTRLARYVPWTVVHHV
eukprot:g1518.t1